MKKNSKISNLLYLAGAVIIIVWFATSYNEIKAFMDVPLTERTTGEVLGAIYFITWITSVLGRK